jgi:predicted RNase H-like HicB family nuclease
MVRYLIVIEKAKGNYSAFSPDLPGCVATGRSRTAAEKNMKKAIEMHVRGLKRDNQPLPEPRSFAEYVSIR